MQVYPVAVFMLIGVLVAAGQALVHQERVREAGYLEKISQLERDKKRVQTLLQRKEREKKQALALAESRSEELWDEIQSRDKQMDKLWEAVGQKPDRNAASAARASGKTKKSHNAYRLKNQYDQLAHALNSKTGELKDLQSAAGAYRREQLRRAQERALAFSTLPSIYPCRASISSPFGYRIHPVLGYAKFHSGVDLCAGYGENIYATAAGRVTCADWLGGYGMAVTIDHGSGLTTLYGHCSSLAVSNGQYVRKGQHIANVGSTGMSTGPHCHYEVHKDGTQIDPMPYLKSMP